MKRRAVLPFVLVFLCGCGWFRLADSPYLRIARTGLDAAYRVAVRPRLVPTDFHAAAHSGPQPAEVRAAACAGLENTRFRCGAGGQPDYVIDLEYDVVDEADFQRGSFSPFVDDPPGDAAYAVYWRFRVTARGAAAPLFESDLLQGNFQMWRFDVAGWMERYFSE